MNARLKRNSKDASDAVSSDIPKVKHTVLQSVAKFANVSTGKLDALLKDELKLRENIALMGKEAADVCANAAANTYRARWTEFYENLTLTDNWTLELALRDAELGVAATRTTEDEE